MLAPAAPPSPAKGVGDAHFGWRVFRFGEGGGHGLAQRGAAFAIHIWAALKAGAVTLGLRLPDPGDDIRGSAFIGKRGRKTR